MAGRNDDFTTYMNIVDDPAFDRKIQRFAETGARGFAKIRMAADQATEASNRLLMGRGSGGLGAGLATRGLNDQATAARNAARAYGEVASVAPRAASSTRAQARDAEVAARANTTLARSLTATATALNVVQGPLGPLAGRFGAAARAIGSLGGVQLGAAGLGGIAFAVARMGNAYAETEGKLRPFFQSQREVNRAMSEVAGIANRSRASLEATADLYTRLTANAANYNWTQQRIGRITELASKSATLSGGTRQSQESGLYQFSQAIGSNRLGGDELRSILENTNQLANSIAQGMGVTIGELRKMGEEGVLTANVVAGALERSADTIESRFARLPRTLSSAATQFGNSFIIAIGHLDKAIGLSSGLASVLAAVGTNLSGLISIAAGVGAAFAAIKVTNWVQGINQARASTQALNFETVRMFETEQLIAATRSAHTRDYLRGLQAQKVALRANIAEEAGTLRGVQGVQAQNATGRDTGGRFVSPAAVAAADGAAIQSRQRLAVMTRDLERVEQELRVTTLAMSAAELEAVAAQEALNVAQASSVPLLQRAKAGIGGFISAIGGWNLAILALGVGLGILASQQSLAEKANERASRQMQEYGRVVDEATGRVRNLTDAERERALANSQETIRRLDTGEGARLRNSISWRFAGVRSGDAQTRIDLSDALGGTQAQYEAALLRIQRLAEAGDQDMQGFLDSTHENRDALQNLAEAARAARGEVEALGHGIDSAVAARLQQATAEFEAALPDRVAAIRDRSRNMNTLNDNDRTTRNLNDIYGELGRGPSGNQLEGPQQLQARMRAIQNFQARINSAATAGRPADELNRMRATLRGMTEDAHRAAQETLSVAGTAGQLARERTAAQNAERNQNRGEAAARAAERAQQARERAAERQRDLQDQRQNILGRYTTEPTTVQRAQNDIRALLNLQRSLGQGLYPDSAMQADVQRIRQGVRRELEQTILERRQDLVGRYIDEPRGIVRAQRDIQDLRKLQQQVGEGLYPAAVMRADEERIRQGVLRPFTELMRQHERDRDVQLLTLQGRSAEATALQQALTLVDSIGKVTEDQYTQLVRNAEENERINTILAQRERLVSNVQAQVDNTAQALEALLMDLRHPAQAAGNFLQTMIRNVLQQRVTQLVERFRTGAEDSVRGLVSARSDAAQSYRQFSSMLTDAGESGMTLANANRRAGDLMLQGASEFLQGIRGLPTPAGGTIGGAATGAPDLPGAAPRTGPVPGNSDLGNWLTSGTGAAAFGQSVSAPVASAVSQALEKTERMRLPFDSGMSSGWGARSRPMPGATANHTGIDWAKPRGTPVQAAFSGEVVTAGPYRGYGNAVIVDHGNGLTTLYGHLDSVAVALHQIVRQGDRLGGVGSTGIATGNNLHFGVYRNGVPINPLSVNSARVSFGGGGAVQPGDFSDSQPVNAGPSNEDLIAAMEQEMRRNGVRSTAQALGAFETVNFSALQKDRDAQNQQQQRVPSARETYNAIGSSVGAQIDKVFGTNGFFTKMGKSFGTALEGAGTGAIASGFLRALGVKQSQTGAQVGGAIGGLATALTGIPGLDVVGGLIGGTIGGLFKKTPSGSATISMANFGGYNVSSTAGNSKQRTEASKSAGEGFIGTLEQMARQLGGTVGDFGSLSFGIRKDKFVIDTSGRGKTKGSTVEKFDSEQEAIARALELAISRGAIQGISAASQRILQSGQDLQIALQKAAIIESIPRMLMQKTNPVLYAVTELNREWAYNVQILREAGATAEQFAQAQQLYELQREEAIKQAAESMFGQIDDYIQEMTSGQSSPLNRGTVYANARAEYEKQVADAQDGVFSQEDLLTAARNFQEASQAYQGSTAGFFADFNTILSDLTAARNAAAGLVGAGGTALPGSPFDDPAVQAQINAVNGVTDAINNQTDTLYDVLQDIFGVLGGSGGTGQSGSTLDYLPTGGGSGGGGGYKLPALD